MPAINEDDLKLFQTIGLSEQKAKETLKNANVTRNLKLTLNEVSDYRQTKFHHMYLNFRQIKN